MVRSTYARGEVEVRFWCGRGTVVVRTVVVRSRYLVVQSRYGWGTLVVWSRYAHGAVEVRLWCGRGTLVVRSRYARGAVRVCSWCGRGTHGVVEVRSWFGSLTFQQAILYMYSA